MRVIFFIVAVLGLALTGLAVFQVRVASDYHTSVSEVQSMLSGEPFSPHRKGLVITGENLGDALSRRLDGVDALERGWFVAALIGIAVSTAGVIGIIVERRREMPPNTH
jgi:hypothetical protein